MHHRAAERSIHLLQERIRAALLSNGGRGPVPGEHGHIVAKREKLLFDSAKEQFSVASW
jgi:hypothetical protein